MPIALTRWEMVIAAFVLCLKSFMDTRNDTSRCGGKFFSKSPIIGDHMIISMARRRMWPRRG
ncbi:hypothetical protein LINGRAHAP2_LOCUS30002 [Linum grandiflorum]